MGNDEDASSRLSSAFRAAGFNARDRDGAVTLSPNKKLAALLEEVQISTVSAVYRPDSNSTNECQWADHHGSGSLPCFESLRQLVLSPWAQRFFLPSTLACR